MSPKAEEALYRVEIILNKAILEDLLDLWSLHERFAFYTAVPDVLGSGSSGQRLGDGVWPELNSLVVLYVPKSHLAQLRQDLRHIKAKFPNEGLIAHRSRVKRLV